MEAQDDGGAVMRCYGGVLAILTDYLLGSGWIDGFTCSFEIETFRTASVVTALEEIEPQV